MKLIKTAVAVLLIAGGTFTAFAFSANKDNKAATTYYPIADDPEHPNNYHWETSVPEGFVCTDGTAVCSITTDTPPTDNQLPSGVPSTSRVYRSMEE
ncbi:hypothetical protein EGI16_12825 [Chryseobacterium sp. G0240]|uniref:hypothetical protein n=1 Tax=Chryseobacterium sp. G0240 TaxID=2487066 RepID=UPI000F45979A|nr:hypothetical protein [Chryseobacterium sp. G0240]ROI02516.1 hypothetical protein EGI16_12825 [Chryseobacterium sp. G0240]